MLICHGSNRKLTQSVITDMQIKTMTRCYYTPIRIAKIKITDSRKHGKGCRETGSLINC